ncbi:MAG: UDP-N-acetylmuramate dehydrogenase [bacterium]|nr:UDP-N-acetylmuramate dehydrogenase [bacterium]
MSESKGYFELIRGYPYLIIRDEPLKNHTWFQIGGNADLFCEIDTPEILISVMRSAKELQIPYVMIGEGSNLLVDDRGYRGLIIKYQSVEESVLDFPNISVSAGMALSDLLSFAQENSLSGFEFLAGIPGSVGGAVYMNAGAYGSSVSDILDSAVIINEDQVFEKVRKNFFDFDYRSSVVQSRNIFVTSVSFKIKRGDKTDIKKEYDRIIAIRHSKHPDKTLPCAGSYFKNLPPEKPGENRRAAGFFLDQAGAKDLKVGGAEVFEKHANMIVNAGNAKASDVLKLAEQMKALVFNKFNFELIPEVKYLDAVKGIEDI